MFSSSPSNQLKDYTDPLKTAHNTFATPAKIMTRIGLTLYFRRKNIPNPNNTTATIFVFERTIAPSPQKAVTINVTPAVAIIAITAGRRAFNTVCKVSKLLYFIYNQEIKVTNTIEGAMFPNVATTAPQNPPILKPTKVAEFTEIGPGVI